MHYAVLLLTGKIQRFGRNLVYRTGHRLGLVGSAELEIRTAQYITFGERERAFQNILQFTYIARKTVLLQGLDRAVIELRRDTALGFMRELFENLPGQQWNVFVTFSKWRYRQLDYVDTVIQILAKQAFLDQRGKIFVAGAENADIDWNFTLCTHRFDGFLLYDAQQFDLHVQWQFRNFIEKQGSPVCCLEQSFLIRASPGEATLEMAEKLAFHQFSRYRTTVDRDEWCLAA